MIIAKIFVTLCITTIATCLTLPMVDPWSKAIKYLQWAIAAQFLIIMGLGLYTVWML